MEATSREKKIRILTAADMEPRHRQRIHDLEDIVASKDAELESAASEVKSRENTITALERKISSMRSSIEEAQEQFMEQQVLNQGAWAKAEDLDKTRQKVFPPHILPVAYLYRVLALGEEHRTNWPCVRSGPGSETLERASCHSV